MSRTLAHDAVVIGAGPAGYVCAIRLGQLGVNTLLVEREVVGGVCLNVGCIPSKALIHAAKQASIAPKAAAMGITYELRGIDLARMQEWKSGIVKKMAGGVSTLLKGNGVTTLMGEARLVSATTVEVKTAEGPVTVTARNVVLATGSRPIEIPGFPFDEQFVLSSTGALALTDLPKHLVVIGGGYIGLELGITWAKLGSKVTVVEMMDQVLPGFSPDVVKLLSRSLQKNGIEVFTGARAKGCTKPVGSGQGAVVIETKDGEKKLAADRVVVCVGRRPNSENLGLQEVGVHVGAQGFVPCDAQRRTNVASIFSIGDLAGQPMLAHKGSAEGEVAAEAISGKPVEYDVRCVPAVVFTDPEIATVGLSEAEAKAKGIDVATGKFPFVALGRAVSTNETDGYAKLIVDRKSDVVVGAEIIGPDASALIAECALAIEMGATAKDIALTVHAHPTLPEIVMEAAKAVHGEAIHVLNK
jgi:dihydrolipoamide dehydrogenase